MFSTLQTLCYNHLSSSEPDCSIARPAVMRRVLMTFHRLRTKWKKHVNCRVKFPVVPNQHVHVTCVTQRVRLKNKIENQWTNRNVWISKGQIRRDARELFIKANSSFVEANSNHRACGMGAILLVNRKPMRCRAAVHSPDARTVMGRVRGMRDEHT